MVHDKSLTLNKTCMAMSNSNFKISYLDYRLDILCSDLVLLYRKNVETEYYNELEIMKSVCSEYSYN